VKEILIVAILAFSLLFSSTPIFAEECGDTGVINSETNLYVESEIPPGMENKKIGSRNFVVPKGTRLYKRGAATFIEGPDAYSARRFETMESRLEKIEKSIKELREEINALQ